MAKLTAAARNKLKKSNFADPEDKKYPDENRSHAEDAKARAAEMHNRGVITDKKFAEINRRADAKLKK